MKTIKDALQASSIEQRRRILNNIGIDKDSKNFIVSGKASQGNGGGSSTGYVKFYRIKDYDAIKEILAAFNSNVRYYESHFEKPIPAYNNFNMVSDYLTSHNIIPDAMVYLTYIYGYSDDDFLEVMKNLTTVLKMYDIDSSCIEEITEEEYYRPLIELENKKEY